MDLIIGEGGPRDPQSLEFFTKAKRRIPNILKLPLLPSRMNSAVELITSRYSTARLRSRSSQYNCVGMVLASRRVWVEIDYLMQILTDDGYREIAIQRVKAGDLVIYREPDRTITHVGQVWSHDPVVANGSWKTIVLSQWGQDGEYFHEVNDVHPRLGHASEYWTERRE